MVMQYVKSGLSAGQGVILGNSYETVTKQSILTSIF